MHFLTYPPSLLCLLLETQGSWTIQQIVTVLYRCEPKAFPTPCSTSVLIPLRRVSLLEQLVINKPRRPWNYDRLNTTPSSLILHPSIHPITYPFIPRLPTAVCMYWRRWWNETFRSTCISRFFWVRQLILS